LFCSSCGVENTNTSSFCAACGRALTLTKPDETPTVYPDEPTLGPGSALQDGRYRIERVLGAGGMGTVYLASDSELGRDVVIKIPHARVMQNPDFADRFNEEIRSQTHLSHRGVIHIYGRGEENGVPYVVMQYVDGGTLGDRLDPAHPMDPQDLLSWLPLVADALDFLHLQHFVHRDVKPDNILFDTHGGVYLSDFGIGKALDDSQVAPESVTKTGMFIGTPAYIAPEYIDREFTSYCDQYSLGVVVYRALTSIYPHEATTPERLMVEKATAQPRPLSELRPELPQALVATVMRALSLKAADRYPTCREFSDDFAHSLGDSTARLDPDRTLHISELPVDRDIVRDDAPNRGFSFTGKPAAVGSVVVLLLIIAAVSWFRYNSEDAGLKQVEEIGEVARAEAPKVEAEAQARSRERAAIEASRAREDAAAIEADRAREDAAAIEADRAREDAAAIEADRARKDAAAIEASRARKAAAAIEASRARKAAAAIEASRARKAAAAIEASRARKAAAVVAQPRPQASLAPEVRIQDQVLSLMGEYESAYEARDIEALENVWQLDPKQRKGMAKFFKTIKRVRMELEIGNIVPQNEGATVEFRQRVESRGIPDTQSNLRATVVRKNDGQLVISTIAPN
jgi:serine/threonine protein kinase